MQLEKLHVSQLYETVLCFTILVLLIIQILVTINKLWGHLTQIRLTEQDDEASWVRAQKKKTDPAEESNYEKFAMSSLRREMSEAVVPEE